MTAKIETENNGKTADNTFKIDCDRVKVTAFAAAHSELYLSRSRNKVKDEHEKRSVPCDILIYRTQSWFRQKIFETFCRYFL